MAVDQIPCTLESVHYFCFDYGALDCVPEEEMDGGLVSSRPFPIGSPAA
jgi:hypothetical protein